MNEAENVIWLLFRGAEIAFTGATMAANGERRARRAGEEPNQEEETF